MPTTLMAVLLLAMPAANERVEYVVSQLVEQGFTQAEAEALFQDPRLTVLPQRDVAPRTIDWDQVIRTLVAKGSVQRGSEFLARYREAFQVAESQYGVDPMVLTALLRMESDLGKNTGNYGTFNVFYTLLSTRQEEKRWRWAGDNLAALAAFCRTMGNDCFEVRGSYGGALGAAQFLPYSVIAYGADGNGDNRIDPFLMEDAIISAANFLVVHGWHEDREQALAKYYGSGQGYPRAVLAYAEALKLAETSSQSGSAQ
jgi:membrane-bound lytic murein transglycosylase B